MNLLSHKNTLAMGALLVALPLGASAQVAVFSDDFTGNNNDDLSIDWNQGSVNTPAGESDVRIFNNAADPLPNSSNDFDPPVFGVDPTVAAITDPNDFSVSTEFRITGGGSFAGIWFQGRTDANSSDQTLSSGYLVRFRPSDGLVQVLNFGATNNWTNQTANANTTLYDTSTDTFGLTVSSGVAANDVDILFENVTDTITLASFTATRPNRNGNPNAGSVFGLYSSTAFGGVEFDSISVIPESSQFALGIGMVGFLCAFARRRRRG
jgi:hypothetical protein